MSGVTIPSVGKIESVSTLLMIGIVGYLAYRIYTAGSDIKKTVTDSLASTGKAIGAAVDAGENTIGIGHDPKTGATVANNVPPITDPYQIDTDEQAMSAAAASDSGSLGVLPDASSMYRQLPQGAQSDAMGNVFGGGGVSY